MEINDRLKKGIVALRKKGIASNLLAKAFGLKTAQIRAYVAWAHPTLAARRKAA